MRFKEYYYGTVLPRDPYADDGGKPVKVYRNPSRSELDILMNNSTLKEVKGIVKNDDIYVWDAKSGIHDFVALGIGIEKYNIGFYVSQHQGTNIAGYKVYTVTGTMSQLIKHPTFMTMMGIPTTITKAG